MEDINPKFEPRRMYWHVRSMNHELRKQVLRSVSDKPLSRLMFAYLRIAANTTYVSRHAYTDSDFTHVSNPYVEIICTGYLLGFPDETVAHMIESHYTETNDPIRYLDYINQ